MRGRSLLVAVILVSTWFTGAGDAAPKADKLRIKPAPLKVGSVRIESSTDTLGGRDSHKVKRTTVLAVDRTGVVTKAKVTYLEIDGKDVALAGKSYVIATGDGELEVTPADGTDPGDEALVRSNNKSFGKLDSTVAMVKDREFVVGTAVVVPAPETLPPGTEIKLTLRTFDAESATFDLAIVMKTDKMKMSGNGWLVVDRKTGHERSTSINVEIDTGRGRTDKAMLASQVTTE